MADLIDVIDAAAARLLVMAGFGAKMEGSTAPTLPEQVKAFEAAVEWAKIRNELRPPEKGKSQFDGIREQFGAAVKRRGRPASAESGPANGSAIAVEPAVATDLFDS